MKVFLLALISSLIFASAASANTVLYVRHRDPGCHWYVVKGKYVTQDAVKGSVTLINQDIAAQVIVGPNGKVYRVKVGAKITLTHKGVYHEHMIGQASDDNHLVLIIY